MTEDEARERVRAARRALGQHTREVRSRLHEDRVAAENERIMRRTPATQATAARLKPNNLKVLIDARVIDGAQERDLMDIARGFNLITSPVRLHVSHLERIDGGQGEWYQDEDLDCVNRYRDWACRLQVDFKLHVQRLVILIAVEGLSLKEADAKIARRKGTARELLYEGLRYYREVRRHRR